MRIEASTLDFGATSCGKQDGRSFFQTELPPITIHNDGTDSLTASINLPSAFVQRGSAGGLFIEPGESTLVDRFFYLPDVEKEGCCSDGAQLDYAISIVSNDPDNPEKVLHYSGTGWLSGLVFTSQLVDLTATSGSEWAQAEFTVHNGGEHLVSTAPALKHAGLTATHTLTLDGITFEFLALNSDLQPGESGNISVNTKDKSSSFERVLVLKDNNSTCPQGSLPERRLTLRFVK